MKKLPRTAFLAVGVALVTQAAQASFANNDLYVGFNSSSASSDYLVDLGQPGTVGVGGNSAVNLSAGFSSSLFNSIFNSSTSGVRVGVVGGQNQFPSSYDLYATALRVGGAGNPAIAGSDLSSFNHSQSTIAGSEVALTRVPFPSAGSGMKDAAKTWTANVSPTFTSSTFYGASGINPSSAFDGSGVVYEDLWKATPASAYSYLGYFTFDLGSGNPSLTFTPSAAPVPEPAATSLLGGAGLLLAFFRNRFRQPKA